MTATDVCSKIDPAELATLLDSADRPLLLDVRTPAEFEAAHLEGAVNVPVSLVSANAATIAPRLKPGTVVLCQSGPRAEQGAAALASAGAPGVRVLRGGVGAWDGEGRPVRRGKQVWAMERQVRMTAGSIVLLGILASLKAPRAKFLAGGIGAGLTFSAASNTCAMAQVLSKMPWNRGSEEPTLDSALAQLSA
ncbi:rhodanese-like domain-containing protein [Nocardioides acrostichi]|uniref:Rhodanese-like domain-containing protein n=1 Tax=Nocardioides acrostichi TaxID=2784339 RepID=A0A930UU77_9ACTN|nr:rhodanese-like domain-containing protein [Nocardioides acrostichi]MBF4160923.1 rhodanese-like domain-containing protein [Nocardioides acrostichi]